MSKKFRLFASVAAPFVSLPLMLQPAGAVPLKPAMETRPAVEAAQMPGIVEVQQQIIVPPEGQEGEGRPRRKPQEEQKQAPQAERPQAPPQAQQQEQPQRQRKAEPEAAPREAAPREAAPRQAPQA
ncbi:Hypothetical protein, partial CDS, partial [Neorhizobium galegae bv. officinalis]